MSLRVRVQGCHGLSREPHCSDLIISQELPKFGSQLEPEEATISNGLK